MIANILTAVIELYVVVLLARAVTSWFPVEPDTAFAAVVRFLEQITEPVLRPVRRLLPPLRVGGMALDLSIIVVLLVLEIVAIPLVQNVF